MRWIIFLIVALAFGVTAWLGWRHRNAHPYVRELKSSYGIVVKGGGIPGHEEEMHKAQEFQDAGDFPSAESIFRRILQKSPELCQAHHELGNVLLSEKKYDEAKVELEEAIRLNPEYAPSYSDLGTIAWFHKDYKVTIEQNEKALSVDSEYGAAYWAIGIAYYVQHNCDSAIPYLARVPKLMPGSIYARKSEEYLKECYQREYPQKAADR